MLVRSGIELKKDYRRWLLDEYVPIVGAEDGDGDGDGSADGDGDGDGSGAASGSGDDDSDDKEDDAAGSGDGDNNDDDGPAARLEGQVKDLTKRLKAAEQAAVDQKKENKKLREEQNSKAGNHKQLAEDRLAEREEADERATKAEGERDEALGKLSSFERTIRVSNIASRMGFKDPGDAMSLLESEERRLRAGGTSEEESDLTGSDAAAERALRKLAEKKKYLVDPQKATGRPMNGSGGGNGKPILTAETIKAMSNEEAAARMSEIQDWQRAQASG